MKKRLPAVAASLALLLTGCGQTVSPVSTTETQPATSALAESVAETAIAETFPLTVTFLKVGKADAIILKTEHHAAVIDCGESSDGDKILDCLNESGMTEVAYMILTHFDQDHIGGAARVIEGCTVQHVIAADYTEESDEYSTLCQAMQTAQLSMEQPSEPMTFALDDCTFTIYPHEAVNYKKSYDNNCSLIVKVEHHGNTLLFAGDAMEERLEEVMDIGDCSLLKVPYHGREISNLPAFLDAVTPEYAVICTSKPEVSQLTLNQLESHGIETFVTGIDGNITAVSDGETITVETSKKK